MVFGEKKTVDVYLNLVFGFWFFKHVAYDLKFNNGSKKCHYTIYVISIIFCPEAV